MKIKSRIFHLFLTVSLFVFAGLALAQEVEINF